MPKKKMEYSSTTTIPSDEEDKESCPYIVPQDLEVMGASALAFALDTLKEANSIREKSKINGRVSGQIKRKILRSIEIINTLIYKAEAKRDPSSLRSKNRELASQIEKLKLEDILMKREVEDMRHMMETMRKEISELKDKLDDAEEDRRKVRESQRIVQFKLNKLREDIKQNKTR